MTRRILVEDLCAHEGTFTHAGTFIDGMKPHPLGEPTGYNRGGGQTYDEWCKGGTRLMFKDKIPEDILDKAGQAIWELDMIDHDDGTGIEYTWDGIGEWPRAVYTEKAQVALNAVFGENE